MSNYERPPRDVHFVGTLAEKDNRSAMKLMLDEAGRYLASMPDGETNRPDYVTDLLENFQKHQAVRQLFPDTLPGKLRHFGDLPFDVLPDPSKLTAESLRDPNGFQLGYANEAAASWRIFQTLKEQAVKDGKVRSDLAFQVGIPGDLQLPFMAFKASGFKESHRKPFQEATAEEMREIYKMMGGEVVFQLELPSENVLTAYTPRLKRPEVAKKFAEGVRDLVLATPEGARIGVHLCNIDMNKKSLLPFMSSHASVTLANALKEAWPEDRAPMEFLHMPWARGDRKPRFNQHLVGELGALSLDPSTKIFIGMSHDEQSYEKQEKGLRRIEEEIGSVGISATCGYGRLRGEAIEYDEETGRPIEYDLTRTVANMRRAVALADSPI